MMKQNLKNSFVEKKKRVGAGGFWKVIDEKKDKSVVKQLTPLSCVAAVGEMLLKSRGISVSQSEIIDRIGQPASVSALAGFLNKFDKPTKCYRWQGLFINMELIPANEALKIINQTGAWGAVMREGNPLGHLVLVEGEDENRMIKIKDSFDGTSYKMQTEEFLKHWDGEVVMRWKKISH